MRPEKRLYREKIFRCGKYIEVYVYPVFAKQTGRGKRRKPTSEAQKKLNEKNSARKLIRLINTNFTEKDIRLDLTYDNDHLPESVEDAQRTCQNFLRRVNYARKKSGMEPLKYVWVTEVGEKSGRVHHHIIMSGGMDVSELSQIWGKGYTTVKPLVFDQEYGAAALAAYMVKKPVLYKRYNSSKNLKQPEEITRDGKLARAKVHEWAAFENDCRDQVEAWYGCKLAEIKPFYNDINTGMYLELHLYQPVERGGTMRKSKRKKEDS